MTVIQEVDTFPRGFSWAAFLMPPIFLMFHKRVGTALLLMFGSAIIGGILSQAGAEPLSWIVSMLISIYFGSAGNTIAWETGRFDSYAALQKSMRRWNIGAVSFLVLLTGLIVLAIAAD